MARVKIENEQPVITMKGFTTLDFPKVAANTAIHMYL